MINPISAISAAQQATTTSASNYVGQVASESGFSNVLSDIASTATQTVRGGEATAIAGLKGEASVQQVAEAVMNAEQTLQTALAVRDKIVSAYQEISRMAI